MDGHGSTARRASRLRRTLRAGALVTGTPITNGPRRLRFEHGEITRQALANACRVTRQTTIALEAGCYASSRDLAFRLVRTFDVGVEDVFRWAA